MTSLKDQATYIIMNHDTSNAIEVFSANDGLTWIVARERNNNSTQKWIAVQSADGQWVFKNKFHDGVFLGYTSLDKAVTTVPSPAAWTIIQPGNSEAVRLGALDPQGKFYSAVEVFDRNTVHTFGFVVFTPADTTQLWVFSEVPP